MHTKIIVSQIEIDNEFFNFILNFTINAILNLGRLDRWLGRINNYGLKKQCP